MRTRGLGVFVLLLALLARPARAEARLCDYLPIACTYEGAPFALTVFDADTRQPLADVHGLAEWQQYGFHGTGGPIMVQDAVSGADGDLKFSPWGPLSGSRTGLVGPNAPVVTLFKPGYKAEVIHNIVEAPGEPNEKLRRFVHDGRTFPMTPFRGTPEEWVAELQKIAFPHMPAGDETLKRFHAPYANRATLAWKERDGLPERFRERGQIFWHLEGLLYRLEKGQR